MRTEEIDNEVSLSRLLEIYHAHAAQQLTRQTIESLRGTKPALTKRLMDELRSAEPVSTLNALRAGHRLATLLTGWRWQLMRDAREQGKTWTEIGLALDMTKQGAYDWYRKAIEQQERYAAAYSDTAAARTVLGSPND